MVGIEKAPLLALLLLTFSLQVTDVFDQQRRLGRGLNLGNWLEAPKGDDSS